MTARLLVLGALLATTSVARAETSAMFVPTKLYAKMFVTGTKFTFKGTRGENEGTERFRLVTRAASVTCSVTNVRPGPDAILADLTCNKEMGSLGGTYGASAKGLYYLRKQNYDEDDYEDDAKQLSALAATVEAGMLVMPAAPKVGTVKAGAEPDMESEVVIKKRGAGFCRRDGSLIGDMYEYEYCFAAGRLTVFRIDDGSAFPVVIRLRG